MSNKPYVRLDKDNAAVLLVDHQTGLLSLVRDIDPDKFKNNVLERVLGFNAALSVVVLDASPSLTLQTKPSRWKWTS